MLDRALFRRFDLTIEYPLPTATVARTVIQNRLAGLDLAHLEWRRITPAARGLSHAEITLAAERAAKDSILAQNSTVSTDVLLAALRERRTGTSPRSRSAHGDS